ncbi:MAG: hypothetical protein WCY19_05590 [Candidatus Gastranaerophilaceae bacterium]
MEIKKISQNFFKTASNKIESNQTNPFGVSFKGNIITADIITADVFTKVGSNLAEKASKKSKMLTSAIVGSINAVSKSISTRLDSVVTFGKRIGANAADLWDKANHIEVPMPNIESIKNIVKEQVAAFNSYSVPSLKKLLIPSIEDEFKNILLAGGKYE